MRGVKSVLMVALLLSAAATPLHAGDSTEAEQPAAAMTPLPLKAPLTPLSSGVLTNVDASATHWRMVRRQLFRPDSTLIGPHVYLVPRSFGAYDAMDEYFLRSWEATPEWLVDREVKRYHLTPDGRVIR